MGKNLTDFKKGERKFRVKIRKKEGKWKKWSEIERNRSEKGKNRLCTGKWLVKTYEILL